VRYVPVTRLAVEVECGKWWVFKMAGPSLLVGRGEVPWEDCLSPRAELRLVEVVACVPLVYRAAWDEWRGWRHCFRPDRLAKLLAKDVQSGAGHPCVYEEGGEVREVEPHVADVSLLAEAFAKMPVREPRPEDLAVEYVYLRYVKPGRLAQFLGSPFVVLTEADRAREAWSEICPGLDWPPRGAVRRQLASCGYPADVAERLAEWARQGLTPALDWRLFGLRGRPWGERPVVVRTSGEARVVYYALGKVLRAAIALGGRPVTMGMPQEPTLDAWL